MNRMEQILQQRHLLNKCQKLVTAKEVLLNEFKGEFDKAADSLITRFDTQLKDLVIELLRSIPIEDENTCILPDMSNCKVIGDFTINEPTNMVQVAELIHGFRNKEFS